MGLEPRITGFKGGGSAHTPVESPDTLRSISYFQVEDLLSEGEIGGLVNGMQSVKLDGTPVANPDGSLNFEGVSVQIRSGTQDQASIPGYGSIKNEISIATELKSDAPWVRQLANTELSAFALTLQVDALQKSNTKNGDINGYLVQYAIDVSTDNGAYNTVVNGAFNGKASGPYQRTIRVDLPKATTGWNVRVRRLTANANSATVADTTRIVSMTEIIDAKLRYPNSAYVAISGDASQFSNVPARSYVCWGRLLRVPSNYDPQTRAYSGVWDGSFKVAWTNNPAWILYDLVTQNRFGLGDRIDASLMDKWELYRIAQYCDQLVDDGKGGQEPRFTCNVYLQNAADAFRLLGDLASVFRGVSYWMGGSITTVADMPEDPVYPYTAANVIGGKFTYQSSARKTRYTTAQVTWNDPANSYKQRVEYVQDGPGIARYGIQPIELVAFGCTSQGQAHRAGLWALTTSQLETDSVTFAVGLEGLKAAPGKKITVQDPARAGARQGGRISDATDRLITVDRAPDVVKVGDTLTVLDAQGVSQTRTISAIDGRNLSVGQPFTDAPVAQSVWTVESAELATQTFRVLNVKEDFGNGKMQFTINAVQHNASKFAHIDSGAQIQIPPISRLPVGAQKPATNVRITSHQVVEQGIANNVMTIVWDAPEDGAATYKVEWQKDNGQWIQAGQPSTTSVDVIGIYTGIYVARVTAINSGGTASVVALSQPTAVEGKTAEPPKLATLTATSLPFGIALDWTFPDDATDTQRTEVWASTNAVRPDTEGTIAYEMGGYAYPTSHTELHGLSAGASLFFWGRIVDKAGNVGGWYPEAGAVNGQTISDPNALQDYWAGTIGKGALQEELISQIDDATSGVGELGEAVGQLQDSAQQLRDDVDAAQADIAAEATARADAISQEAQDRIDGDQAEAQARAADLLAEAQARGAAITSEKQERQDADGSLSTRIDTATAAIGENAAAIQDEAAARATADSTEANQRSILATQMRGGYSGSDLNQVTSGLIAQEKTARSNQFESLAQQMTLLSAGVGEQFDSAKIWYFDSGAEGWTGNGAPTYAESWLRPANAASDPWVASPPFYPLVRGAEYDQIRLRVRKHGNPTFEGFLWWQPLIAKQFAIADGAAIAYQLTDGAGQPVTSPAVQSVYLTDWHGRQKLYATPRKNFIRFSEALASWGKSNATVVAADTVSVNGEAVATRIAETASANTQHRIQITYADMTVGITYVAQFVAKAAERSFVNARQFDSAGRVVATCVFGLSGAGSIGATTGTAAGCTIVPLEGGLYLCTMPFTQTVSSNGTLYLNLAVNSTGGTNYDAVDGYGLYVGEVGLYDVLGAYIRTSGTTTSVTDYTVDDSGIVDLGQVPAEDAVLEWIGTGSTADGTYYSTVDDTWSEANRVPLVEPSYDENGIGLISVSTHWQADVARVRVDLSTAQTATDYYDIDWVAVGRPAPGASSAALAAEQTARATADSAEVTARETLSTKLTGLADPTGASLPQLTSGLIYDERTARSTADGALASSITQVQAQVGENTAAITSEQTARADADSALSTRIDTVTATANNAATKAALTNEQTARADADGAMAQDIALIGAHTPDKSAFILNQQTTKVDGDTTLGQWMTSVSVSAGDLGARIDSEVTARTDADGALGQRIDSVQATAEDNAAAISAEAQARADADSALASRTDAIEASVTLPVKAGADGTPAGANTRKAGIYTYSVARVDGDMAEAKKTEQLSAIVDQNNAAVQVVQQAVATLDGKVSASYTVKTQISVGGVPYAAGFAVGVDYSGGTISSQFIVNATTFAIIDANSASGNVTYAFVYQNGQAFINQALIGDGWITNAMIGNQIKSTAVNNAGLPTWEINKTGTRYVRGNNFTITEDSTSWRFSANATGVIVLEIGDLG